MFHSGVIMLWRAIVVAAKTQQSGTSSGPLPNDVWPTKPNTKWDHEALASLIDTDWLPSSKQQINNQPRVRANPLAIQGLSF